MEEKRKINVAVLVVLLLVCFPAAIIYAIVAGGRGQEDKRPDPVYVKICKILGWLGIVSYAVATVFCFLSAFNLGLEYRSMRIGMGALFLCVLILILILNIFAGKSPANFFSLILNAGGALIYFKTVNDQTVKIFTVIGLSLSVLGLVICLVARFAQNASRNRYLCKNDPVYKKVFRKLRVRKFLTIIVNLIIVFLSVQPWCVILNLENINPIYMLVISSPSRYEISFFLSWLVCGIIVYIIKRGNPVDSVVTFKDTKITEEYELHDDGFLTESYEWRKTGEKKRENYHDVVLFKGAFILYVLFFLFAGLMNIVGLFVSLFAPAKIAKIFPCVGIPKGSTLPAEVVLYKGGFALFMQFWLGFLSVDGDSYFDYLYSLYL